MKYLLTTIFVLLFTLSLIGQETVTVISTKANLRGTPDTKGVVVTTVRKGEKFSLIKQVDAWFLVQTPTYVGWIHGSTIELNRRGYYLPNQITVIEPEIKIPQPTNKRPTDDAPFVETFVGGDSRPTITIFNDTNRIVSLTFGGAKYVLKGGEKFEITVDAGNYEYFASAPGVMPLSGVKKYNLGYKYTWKFYIE